MSPICTKPVSSHDFYTLRLTYHFVEYSLCYTLVKTRSQYYFSIQSNGNLNTAKTSNLKDHNSEKMAVKEKNHISTSFKRTFKMAKNTKKI